MAVYGGSYQMSLGHEIEFPKLNSKDHERIRQALSNRGFVGHSIPHRNTAIDFSDLEFPPMTSFMGFVLGGATKFDRAKFPVSIAFFNETIFAGNISFDEAEFCGDFVALKSEFAGSISFNRAKFYRSAAFSGCKFMANVEFEEAQFLGDTYFNGITFGREARFGNTTFEQEADFSATEFKGATYFLRTKFKTRIPRFFEATLHEYTEWYDSEWPKVPDNADDARDQVQRYQRLIRLMNGTEKFNDQHFFFRKELNAQRRAEGWSVAAAMNFAYRLVCEYGYGLSRIVFIWLAHILLGTLALWGVKVINASESAFPWHEAYSAIGDLPDALAISFANAHALLNLSGRFLQDAEKQWEGVALFSVIGIAQTVSGVIILFFLLLTIRNRFRMR